MNFNLKRVSIENHKEDVITKFKQERDTKFIIYLVNNYEPFNRKENKKFNVRVWSIIDKRYILDIYTNDIVKAAEYAQSQFKKKYSIILDIRDYTQTEINQKFKMRF